MVVGVNGVGKTTTVGKIARVLVAQDKDVLLGAADTFRAAAADQLTTWGERVGVPTVRGDEGADPASVAFEACEAGVEQEVDTVLIDTAGRLHTKTGLMDELGKVKRVVEKQAPVDEVLLVIDATTGQNGLTQARIFAEVVDVTGIVLDEARRHGQGRHRDLCAARARCAGQARRVGRRRRRPGAVRGRGVRRRPARQLTLPPSGHVCRAEWSRMPCRVVTYAACWRLVELVETPHLDKLDHRRRAPALTRPASWPT